ncbi:MAG: RodZ domain-containing protein [Candidatus Korobacteraceae bacterium]
MGAFGERLRREREMRNISLDEISSTTKIGTRLLRALEDEQFDQLPGGIFNKGYVRAYAKYVGIDEEQAVADYLQATHEATPDGHAAAGQNASSRFEGSSREEASGDPRPTFPVVPILIVLVLVAGIAGGWRLYREHQLDRQQQASIAVTHDTVPHDSTVSPSATGMSAPGESSSPKTGSGAMTRGATDVVNGAKPADARAGASGASSAASHDRAATSQLGWSETATKPVQQASRENVAGATAAQSIANSATGTPFELTVRPKDPAWVSIKSDGKFVVRGIIKPPDVKTIRATSQVVLWTGNAGAVEVSFNGKNIPLTGGANEERVLVFNSHGLLPSSASP